MNCGPVGLILLCAATAALLSLHLLSVNTQAEDAGFGDMSFAFAFPEGWTVSCSDASNAAAGNLSLQGPGKCISLSWARDPGLSLREILDMVQRAYDSDEVEVISSKPGRLEMQGCNAETLSLIYEFEGCRTAKQFAIWNSSQSDRIFLASLSGHSTGDEATESSWNRFTGSFQDLGGRDPISLNQASLDGAWSRLLGDQLCCYHYEDTAKLPGSKAHVAITHQLTPVNGSYILDSWETIRVDPPVMAAARAGATAEILHQAGYECRLMQRGGMIAIAVLDPSGSWQKVSINPSSPERCIGVLLNERSDDEVYQIYHDLRELAGENGINDSLNPFVRIIKDCEPPSLVKLGPGNSQPWQETLQDLLDSYDYGEYYNEGVFDCSDTAQICSNMLQEKGYDARLMMSYPGHPLDPHMWVAVRSPQDGGFVAVETANTNESKQLVHLGRIVTDEKYYQGIMYNSSAQFSRLHPEEGIY